MGQPVAVVMKPSSQPGVVRFESNRNLTGMGHETFLTADDAHGTRPAATLARQMLATGHVGSVHVFGNIITVDLKKGYSAEGLIELVRDMYQYWKPGMEPPAFEEVAPAEEAAAAPAGGGDAPAGGAMSEYQRLVPANLIERSAAALAKWKANH